MRDQNTASFEQIKKGLTAGGVEMKESDKKTMNFDVKKPRMQKNHLGEKSLCMMDPTFGNGNKE